MRLTQRVAKLEAEGDEGFMFWVWRKMGETAAQAEARFLKEHPEAAGQPLTVIGWLDA